MISETPTISTQRIADTIGITKWRVELQGRSSATQTKQVLALRENQIACLKAQGITSFQGIE